jgi:hypothetical protein
MKWGALAALLLPVAAAAQGLKPGDGYRPDVVFTFSNPSIAIGAVTYQVFVAPWPATVQRLHVMVGVASGGGAGSTVFRVSDGTNHCDATLLCTDSAVPNTPRTLTPTGSCIFARGATLSFSVTATTCTTTQPTVRGVVGVGLVRR